jgi:cytosine/uracil/thiamine/allantoin permease
LGSKSYRLGIHEKLADLIVHVEYYRFMVCLSHSLGSEIPLVGVLTENYRLTMGTNIPDFTRYLKKSRGVYWQALFMPFIASLIGIFGIIAASAGKVLYGTYIWDPLQLAANWDGPSGRAGAFFVGLCWVVAQIGTNISANVISCSNDMVRIRTHVSM